MKTEWDLTLLYSSPKDPSIEKDILAYEKACDGFQKKYKESKKFLSHDGSLAEALTEYEHFYSMPEGNRPATYFFYRKELNSNDPIAQAALNKISERLSKANNKIVFFELFLGKISVEQQKKFLASKKLAPFRYFLERLFLTASYNLSEPEEKILNLISLPSYSLWVQGQDKLLSQQTITFKGKELPIPAALSLMSTMPTKDRHAVNILVSAKLKAISFFAESELSAVYTHKKISDDLRGFKEPYSATILGNHDDEKSIINLVATVTKNFNISHRFYKLKARLAKLDRLDYSDRSAKIGTFSKEFSFEESARILTTAFDAVDPEFSAILISYLERGQIDVFPKKGKTGGAYCSGNSSLPTFVLLNHVNTLDSLKTFAHEMGHAIHTEFSKSQRPFYEHYTISVAEVASTLFENFAFQAVFETLTEKQKIIALHDRLNDFIATIFRQIACFNYEIDLHKILRTKGALSKEDLAALHNKHMKAYLGPLFDMKDDDGYFFVYWSHLRRFFYVYSYAYGALISSAMYRRYVKDPHYIESIKTFLKAGSSKSPADIFKDIGIDTTHPAFFEEGLKLIEDDIKKLEKLLRLASVKTRE